MISASLLPFIAIYLQFAYFSANELTSGLKKPKMNLVKTVDAETTQDDFDTSQWASVFFSCICGTSYLIIIAEIAIV